MAALNVWLVAALVLLADLGVCGWLCLRGSVETRLVGLLLAGEVATLVLVALAIGYHRDFYLDAALLAAILPYPSSIVFARFFERWV